MKDKTLYLFKYKTFYQKVLMGDLRQLQYNATQRLNDPTSSSRLKILSFRRVICEIIFWVMSNRNKIYKRELLSTRKYYIIQRYIQICKINKITFYKKMFIFIFINFQRKTNKLINI